MQRTAMLRERVLKCSNWIRIVRFKGRTKEAETQMG